MNTRTFGTLLAFAALTALASRAPAAHPSVSVLDIQIFNLKGQLVVSMRVRLTEDPAYSCIGDGWRRAVVESKEAKDLNFFPLSDDLSYKFKGEDLTIGRNSHCDAYLYLDGRLASQGTEGDYTSFGIRGGEKLGSFKANVVE
jgi:hypothetical protein